MSLAKKKNVLEVKRRVQEKLADLREQREAIISGVNEVCHKAESQAQSLLQEMDKSRVMTKFVPVMRNLEEAVNNLFLIQASMPSDDIDTENGASEYDSDHTKDEPKLQPSSSAKPEAQVEEKPVSAPSPIGSDGWVTADSSLLSDDTPPVHAVPALCPLERSRHLGAGASQQDTSNRDVKSEATCRANLQRDAEVLSVVNRPKETEQVERNRPKEAERAERKLPKDTEQVERKLPKETDQRVKNRPTENEQVVRSQSKETEPAEWNLRKETDQTVKNRRTETERAERNRPKPAVENLPKELSARNAPAKVHSQPEVGYSRPKETVKFDFSKSTHRASAGERDEMGRRKKTKAHSDARVRRRGEEAGAAGDAKRRPRVAEAERDTASLPDAEATSGPTDTDSLQRSLSDTADQNKESLQGRLSRHFEPPRRRPASSHRQHASKSQDVIPKRKSPANVPPRAPELQPVERTSPRNLGPCLPVYDLKKNNKLDVFVTEVFSPSLFWIQPQNEHLEDMMDELKLFQSRLKPGDQYHDLQSAPPAGTVLCAQFKSDQAWYRARVTRVYQYAETAAAGTRPFEVDLIYVDYGNRELRVGPDRLRPLHQKFARLPCHAFPSALHQIGPTDGGTSWTVPQCIQFANNVLRGVLFHAVVHTVRGSPLLFVELYYPSQTLPTVAPQRGGPTASLLCNLGETMINAGQAMQVENRLMALAFQHYTNVPESENQEHLLSQVMIHSLQSPTHCLDEDDDAMSEARPTEPEHGPTRTSIPAQSEPDRRATRTSRHAMSELPDHRATHALSQQDHRAAHALSEPDHNATYALSQPDHRAAHALSQPDHRATHAQSEPDNRATHAPSQPDNRATHAPSQPDNRATHAPSQPDHRATHAPSQPDHRHALSQPELGPRHALSRPEQRATDSLSHALSHPEPTPTQAPAEPMPEHCDLPPARSLSEPSDLTQTQVQIELSELPPVRGPVERSDLQPASSLTEPTPEQDQILCSETARAERLGEPTTAPSLSKTASTDALIEAFLADPLSEPIPAHPLGQPSESPVSHTTAESPEMSRSDTQPTSEVVEPVSPIPAHPLSSQGLDPSQEKSKGAKRSLDQEYPQPKRTSPDFDHQHMEQVAMAQASFLEVMGTEASDTTVQQDRVSSLSVSSPSDHGEMALQASLEQQGDADEMVVEEMTSSTHDEGHVEEGLKQSNQEEKCSNLDEASLEQVLEEQGSNLGDEEAAIEQDQEGDGSKQEDAGKLVEDEGRNSEQDADEQLDDKENKDLVPSDAAAGSCQQPEEEDHVETGENITCRTDSASSDQPTEGTNKDVQMSDLSELELDGAGTPEPVAPITPTKDDILDGPEQPLPSENTASPYSDISVSPSTDEKDEFTKLKEEYTTVLRAVVANEEAEKAQDEIEIGGTAVTLQQKMKSYGFPSRLPQGCKYGGLYQKWFRGEQVKVTPGEQLADVAKDVEVYRGSRGKRSRGKKSVSSANSSIAEAAITVDSDEQLQYKPQEVEVPSDGCVQFLMSFILSPSSFWIHLVTEGASRAVDTLMKELNDIYRGANAIKFRKLFQNWEPKRYDVCCAQFSEDNKFYRAQVTNFRYQYESCDRSAMKSPVSGGGSNSPRSPFEPTRVHRIKVFYIDFGNWEWVPPKKVFPLPLKFLEIPPQAIECKLANLEPLGRAESPLQEVAETRGATGEKLLHWSRSACNNFVRLTGFEKKLYGYVMNPDSVDTTIHPSSVEPLELKVVDTSETQEIWINDLMVARGLARETKIAAIPGASEKYNVASSGDEAPPGLVNEDMAMQHWNPMEEDYLSLRNSYQVDVDDPQVATMAYKSQDNICKYFASGRRCWEGSHCRNKHVRITDDVTQDTRQVFCMNDSEYTLQAPSVGSWVAVELTAVFNPAHAYVIFPFGTRPILELIREDTSGVRDEGYEGSQTTMGESLERLKDSMNEHYSHLPFSDSDLSVYALGEIVAAVFSGDCDWYRGRVINSDPDKNKVEVFFLDYGNSEWVPETSIRQMQPQFLHLPFQALECFLPLVPVSDDYRWSKQARDLFAEIAEGKILFAKILARGHNGIVCVELFNTEGEHGEEININQSMVDRGHARIPDGDDCLFPSSYSSHGSSSLSRSSSRSSVHLLPG